MKDGLLPFLTIRTVCRRRTSVMGIVRMSIQVESPAQFAALKLRSGKSENGDGIRHVENIKVDSEAY